MRFRVIIGIFPLLLAVSLLSGCGGSTGNRLPINGKVNYKGQPLEYGSIEFIPAQQGKSPSGAQISNGTFTIPADQGLEPGTYAVRISMMEIVTPAEPGGLPGKDPKELLPAKYNSKSTLSKEIKPGETEVVFDLTDDAK